MDVRAAPVQPVGSGTRSPTGVSALVPVLALVLVVGAARAGAEPPGGSQGGPLASSPGGLPGDGAPAYAGRHAFPSLALGLPVMTGQELQAARASGQVGRQLVAVSGLLHNDPLALACPAIRITFSRTFCRRLVALFPDVGYGPAAVAAAGDGTAAGTAPAAAITQPTAGAGPTPPPALMAQVLPGAAVPVILTSESDLAPWLSGAIPVVAVGHYDDSRAPGCGIGRDWCGDDFVVERLAWLDGAWVAAVLARDPAISGLDTPDNGPRAREIAQRAASRGEQILSLAIVGSRLLAIVDLMAAAVAGPDGAGTLWYVRSITRLRTGAEAEVAWAVIDDATGRVLGYSMAHP
jgi:hypothetical protein